MDRETGESINGVRPSLGLAWADMVTMRLMLTREEGVESCEDIVQKVSDSSHRGVHARVTSNTFTYV